MIISVERRHWWIGATICLLVIAAFLLHRRPPVYIAPEAVWRQAQIEGRKHDLEPAFLLAIAMAESSFNAHADSGYARGLMQVSAGTWRDMTHRPYRAAFDWRRNMAVAARYLATTRDQLVEAGRFDDARLAAAYRHGYGALLQADFDLSRLPQPRNRVYQELFAGRVPPPAQFGVNTPDRQQ